MKKLLAAIGIKLLAWSGRFAIDIDPEIAKHALDVVQKIEAEFAAQSPEWKRDYAFKAIPRVFPDAAKRDVAAAIEWAVRNL